MWASSAPACRSTSTIRATTTTRSGRGGSSLAFKALRQLQPDYPLWRDFLYEYETRLAIDVINGSPLLREWVDDAQATVADFEALGEQG